MFVRQSTYNKTITEYYKRRTQANKHEGRRQEKQCIIPTFVSQSVHEIINFSATSQLKRANTLKEKGKGRQQKRSQATKQGTNVRK